MVVRALLLKDNILYLRTTKNKRYDRKYEKQADDP